MSGPLGTEQQNSHQNTPVEGGTAGGGGGSAAASQYAAHGQQQSLQCSLSQASIQQQQETGGAGWTSPNWGSKENSTAGGGGLTQSEWHPASAHLCAYHDCRSLAYAWGLGTSTASLETTRPTGASQAQSPADDDPGDGKSNDLLASCPAFRNEMGTEPVRRIALSRLSLSRTTTTTTAPAIDGSAAAEEVVLHFQTWHREPTAAEVGVLEDVSNVYLGGRLCAARQPKIVVEPQDMGSYYYRHCFAGRAHVEYCGMDESLGPICVSMVREESKDGTNLHVIYRLILRVSDLFTMRVSVPEEALSDSSQDRSTRNLMRELLEIVCPQIHFGCLRPTTSVPKVEEILLKIDEQPIYTRYKVGVLYCNAGQSTEEQMYNNENSSPHLEEFLDFLGTRVRLKGFESYKGGLDTRGDTTGMYSIYTEHHSAEKFSQIMFHVSTMLPFTPNNKQQLARKRHIGNDMVTIIFQEPDALPFSPITVRSHFQHVFIVVRVCNPLTENVAYRVAVSRAKDVPAFGPAICSSATYQKSADFHDFLITKIINAENAVHRSRKFASMAARTRREALKDLVENYTTAHSNEGASRIASRLLGGSVKRRERVIPKPMLAAGLRAALSWQVEVFDHSFGHRLPVVLGLSADNLVLLDIPTGMAIFTTPTHSILGWTQTSSSSTTEGGLKVFYDHGDMLLLWCVSLDGTERELGLLLKRLAAVTNGDEAKEVMLRKNKPSDSFGFHIQEEGIVTDVDMNKSAWRVGLRQGSRIVEMENGTLIAYSQEHIMAMLNDERALLKLTIIGPASDGNPRRGCEDPNCSAVRSCGQEGAQQQIQKQQQMLFNAAMRGSLEEGGIVQRRATAATMTSSGNHGGESYYWSAAGPQMSLSAVQERKKLSAPAFGNRINKPKLSNSSVDAVQPGGFFRNSQKHFSSEDGQKKKQQQHKDSGCAFSSSPSAGPFNRTRSDEASITRPPTTTATATMDDSMNAATTSGNESFLLHTMTTAQQTASSTTVAAAVGIRVGGRGAAGHSQSQQTTQEMLYLAAPDEENCSSFLAGQQNDAGAGGGGPGSNATVYNNSSNRRRISVDGELTKCQWWLQKTLAEKRELEAELDTVRAQLTVEQRAHENTRNQLQVVTDYCERFSIIPPPFEEEDEEL